MRGISCIAMLVVAFGWYSISLFMGAICYSTHQMLWKTHKTDESSFHTPIEVEYASIFLIPKFDTGNECILQHTIYHTVGNEEHHVLMGHNQDKK